MRGELTCVRRPGRGRGRGRNPLPAGVALGLEKGCAGLAAPRGDERGAAAGTAGGRLRGGAGRLAGERGPTCVGVYARFTEGFSFPDLAEAAALMGDASCERIKLTVAIALAHLAF